MIHELWYPLVQILNQWDYATDAIDESMNGAPKNFPIRLSIKFLKGFYIGNVPNKFNTPFKTRKWCWVI